jgi:5S rRNA maturation endonuclease (ribonuclease M5)
VSKLRCIRVSRKRPCPICGKPDWCLLDPDGRFAICPRTPSPRRAGEAGYVHYLTNVYTRQPRRANPIAKQPASPAKAGDGKLETDSQHPPPDFWARLARQYQSQLNETALAKLADALGLSVKSLRLLNIGWSAKHKAWTFPMRDAGLRIVGIRLRRQDGSKFCVKGSNEGLFIPDNFLQVNESRLAVCEGATDVAALLDLGFRGVIGRPSCLGGVKLIVELCRARRFSEVVIFADNDPPGQRGAQKLGCELSLYVPKLRIVTPPTKDVREWKKDGANRADVERAIAEAAIISLAIRAG